jgi:hypothetical protein
MMTFTGTGASRITQNSNIFQSGEIRTTTVKNTTDEAMLTMNGTGAGRSVNVARGLEVGSYLKTPQINTTFIYDETGTNVGLFVYSNSMVINRNTNITTGCSLCDSVGNAMITFTNYDLQFGGDTICITTPRNTTGGGNWTSAVVNYNEPIFTSMLVPRGIRNITTTSQHGFQWSDGVNMATNNNFGVSYSIKADGWCVINMSIDVSTDPNKTGQTLRWYPPVPVSSVIPTFYNTPIIGTIFNGSQSHGIYLQLVTTFFKVVYANYHGGSHGDFTENLLETYDLTLRGSFEYPTNICSFA